MAVTDHEQSDTVNNKVSTDICALGFLVLYDITLNKSTVIFSILNIVGDPRPPQLLGKINASLFLTLEFPHTIFFETVAGQYQNKGLVSFLLILFVSILPFVTSHFQIYSSRLSSPLLISTSSISLRCTCSFLCGWMCVCVCVCVRHTP